MKVFLNGKIRASLGAVVNPGNPTKETVKALRTIKLGHYHQVVTACSTRAGCLLSPKYPIYVIK